MSNWGYTEETAPAGLRDAYRWLAPDPDAVHGSVLPYAADPKTKSVRLAMPTMLRDFFGGMLDLMAVMDTGEMTPRAATQFALGSIGAGATLAPRGALAAGAARGGGRGAGRLAMDEASRLGRARAMGFDPDLKLYHATQGPDFREFGFGLGSPQSAGLPSVGIWTAENPAYTNAMAQAFGTQGAPAIRVMPLVARKQKWAPMELKGTETPFEIDGAIRGAWHDGYDSIRFLNYNTLPDGTPTPTWIFREPNQLRSRFAAFDPAKRDSTDLMAGYAVPAPTPGFNVQADTPGFNVRPEREPSLAERAMWLRRMQEQGR